MLFNQILDIILSCLFFLICVWSEQTVNSLLLCHLFPCFPILRTYAWKYQIAIFWLFQDLLIFDWHCLKFDIVQKSWLRERIRAHNLKIFNARIYGKGFVKFDILITHSLFKFILIVWFITILGQIERCLQWTDGFVLVWRKAKHFWFLCN